MSIPDWAAHLFQTIDARDSRGFIAQLSQQVQFRFGNAEPVQGRDAVEAMIVPFFQAIAGLQHELIEAWVVDATTIIRGNVSYTRHDGTTLTVPFANVMKRSGTTIDEYLIYVDASALFGG